MNFFEISTFRFFPFFLVLFSAFWLSSLSYQVESFFCFFPLIYLIFINKTPLRKLKTILGFYLKLNKLLPNKIKLAIYNSLFKSHLENGIVAWGNSADPGIKRTCSLQKRSVRHISNARSKQHTSNLFAEHKILKFHDLVKHCELSFMYKYVYSILPSSFNDMFVKLNSFDRSRKFSNGGCQKVIHENTSSLYIA